ncbi:ectonucleotide pyrophosphatase/phosphodiesterase family member 3-like, partial [Saccoglossus kowalevskii]|uniref:Ectonucleotide pyrophosphatase/phosphodiesterase family member 3-like n=1 Tax=Saccoglossus kowalevskii TaxID=10224 RepID=A0ABM0M7P0_SACKO
MADIDDVKMEMGKKDDVTASNTARPTKEKSFYQKHKVVIWIVVALVVFAIAAGIGVGIAKALEDDLEYHRKVWFHGACPKDRESCPSGFDRAPLIVVGLNGFTGDIFDRHLAKHIHKLRECGAHTPNMSSMFPLSTYPNYYSIATGLYPDVHGIVDDYMVDEDYDTVWENGTDRSRPKDKVTAARWYKGEPIWATARKKHRNSAALLWPGSDVPIEAPNEDNSATRRQEWLCTGVAPEYFFNNLTSRMLFIGTGYAFRHNFTLETNFRSIELYNVMAELLDIEGDPNNGTEGAIRDSLREPKNLMRTLPQVSRPINALYPNDDMYELRIQDDGTDCNCDNIDQYFTGSQYDIDYFNDRLDVEDSKITDNRDDAPFGLPTIFNLTTEQPGNYSLLTNEEYIVAWDNYLKVPKYITYSLEKQYTNRGSFNEIINCIRQDVRLIDDYEPRCSDYELLGLHNITLGFMIYPASALTMRQQMDMLLTSNTAPMFKEFEKGIWKFLHEKYNDWADEFNGINIIIGPVFDTNHDGKLDTHEDMADSSFWIGSTPMPSHFFALLTRCKQGKLSQYCDYEDREYLSFVLPNVNEIKNCQ